jgi:hypothetical protein
MRRLIALALIVALTLALTAPAAEARHGHGHLGIGIGAAVGLVLAAPFIIVGSIFAPLVHQPPVYAYPPPVVPQAVYAPPVYAPPPPVYPSRTLALQPPPASYSTTVQYPHGRYELRGDGVYTAYQWVWIPNAPLPPPPPAAPPPSQ